MAFINEQIAFVADTAAVLHSSNVVLEDGQVGVEIDSRLFKVGNGVTPWNDLPYANINSVQSVWVGLSQTISNILRRSSEDGGIILPSSDLPTSALLAQALTLGESYKTLGDVGTDNRLAFHALAVLVGRVVQALGVDYEDLLDLDNTTAAPVPLQSVITQSITNNLAISNYLNDSVTVLDRSWSSKKISDSISLAVSQGLGDLIGLAPEELNTIYELASAVSNNSDVIDGIINNIAGAVRFTPQVLSEEQKEIARDNIGAINAEAIGGPNIDGAYNFVAALNNGFASTDPVIYPPYA